MIDLNLYLRECSKPYDPVTDNCLTAALAAFPHVRELDPMRVWWRDVAPKEISRAAVEQHAWARVAEQIAGRFGIFGSPYLAPTGHEIGMAQLLADPNVRFICVSSPNGRWYGRTHRGVTRAATDLVQIAWRVDPWPK